MGYRRPGKIAEAAKNAGIEILPYLTELIEQFGSVEDAAQVVGVKSWAVRRMLAKFGYHVETHQVAKVVPIKQPNL